ncbi:MAG TPA: LLM class flavin-dependent oxidoreductase [Acidimicrobiales bacterium]|nr:LLM class flavin-dependent oxidoreductase [Acidimicrobiales bacterium]
MVAVRRPFRLGLELPALGVPTAPSGLPDPGVLDGYVAAVAAAQEAGFDAVWFSDRGEVGEATADALTLAGGLAEVATTLTLGVIADVVDARHPAVLARDVTCLDQVSAGRSAVLLFDSGPARPGSVQGAPGDPLGRLGEAAAICRSLFTHAEPAGSGRFFRLGEVNDRPRPVQLGGPGIVVDLGRLAHPDGETARGPGAAPEGLVECLRSADAVVTGGGPGQVRSIRRVIGNACRTAGLGSPPPLLWRGSPPAEGAVLPVAAPLSGHAAGIPVTMRALTSAGADGVIVRLGRNAPPGPDEVSGLGRRWGG